MKTDRLGRLVVTFGPQGLVSAIADACAELATWADQNGRHDIAVRLRHDDRIIREAANACKVWDCSAIADCPIGLRPTAV